MIDKNTETDRILKKLKKRFGEGQKSSYIAQLQFYVLSSHNFVEKQIEERIFKELEIEIPTSRSLSWRSIRIWAEPFMTALSFVNKLDLVRNYNDMKQKDYQKIRRLNTFRNDFAHLSAEELSKKYENEPEGGRELLSSIDNALTLIDEYIESSYEEVIKKQERVLRMREGVEEVAPKMNKRYARLSKKSALKRIVLMQKKDESLGDIMLSKDLYIELNDNGEPKNELVRSAIANMSGIVELEEE